MAELFYIMGASGCGKDSLIDYVRRKVSFQAPLIFAHRYITRPADAGGENHISLSEREFDKRLNQGFFALHWQSHGFKYGVGIEINHWLAEGINVVVNGSRGYLPKAVRIYPEIKPVMIYVSKEKLLERLQNRGRESAAEIENRLQRAAMYADLYHPALRVVSNDRGLQQSGEKFLHLLLNIDEDHLSRHR